MIARRPVVCHSLLAFLLPRVLDFVQLGAEGVEFVHVLGMLGLAFGLDHRVDFRVGDALTRLSRPPLAPWSFAFAFQRLRCRQVVVSLAAIGA